MQALTSHNNSGWHAAGLGARLTQGVAHASAYGSGCGMLMVAGACSFGGHAAMPVTQGTTCRICGSHGVEQEARQVTHTPREDGSFKRAVQHAPRQGCPAPVVDAARLRNLWQARTGEKTPCSCAVGQLKASLLGTNRLSTRNKNPACLYTPLVWFSLLAPLFLF